MKSLSRKATAIEPSQTLALFARAKRMKAEGIDVVSLTAGEPDFPTPAAVKEAGIKAIQENFTKYTPNAGIAELLQAIAQKLKRENQIDVEPAQVLVSNGAKHSVFNALQAICNKGDEVIIPSPFWVSYPEMAKLVDATPVLVRTRFADQFKMTPAQLRKAITKKTKALIINSPCNPTGAVYTAQELKSIAEVIEESGIYVISDEIYEKVIFDGMSHFSLGSIKEIRNQIITVNGCSKAYSMTGWRIGYMAASLEIIKAAECYQGQVTSNANSIAQRAALAALTADLSADLKYMVSEFDRRRKYLLNEFASLSDIEYVHPRGAFYLFFNVKHFLGKSADGTRFKTSDDLCEYLLTRFNVAMVPGTGFGDKTWIRLSYACSLEELQKGVQRIREGLSRIK